jgi:hypothetical protein
VAGFLCGGPGSIFVGGYNADATANLVLKFVGATNVKTADGIELYKWTTVAHSGLLYGSRNDNPPSNPTLIVAPSSGGTKFSNLSWNTVATEYYTVQSSPDGTEWSALTEVLGTGNPVSIDVINPHPGTLYRLISQFGAGTPNPSLRSPAMSLFRNAGGNLLVAWQTNHWENYSLNQIGAGGGSTPLQSVQGDGGAVRFEFPFAAPGRIFQIAATRK